VTIIKRTGPTGKPEFVVVEQRGDEPSVTICRADADTAEAST